MNMKYHIGIDVGKKGGIVVLDSTGIIHGMFMIPLIGKEVDLNRLDAIFVVHKALGCHCVIEDVHSIFGAGAKSNFQFGRVLGMLESLLVAHKIPYTKVQPKKWQAEMWEGVSPILINTGKHVVKTGAIKYKTDTKATSLLVAKRLFPTASFLATERSSVPHDGIVDAALMAEYSRRKFN